MEDPPWPEVTVKEVRDALAKLVTEGLFKHYNVGENGGCLLRLAVVQDRWKGLDGNASEDQRYQAYAQGLRAILAEAIEDEDFSGKARRLLQDVLPLREELRGMAIKERRVEASMHTKPGEKIKPGTIRTYYEPKALKKLAEALLQLESGFRAAFHDGKSSDSDEEDS